jgi:hypothetical protein
MTQEKLTKYITDDAEQSGVLPRKYYIIFIIRIIIGLFHIAANRLDKRVTLRYENINIKTMIKKTTDS